MAESRRFRAIVKLFAANASVASLLISASPASATFTLSFVEQPDNSGQSITVNTDLPATFQESGGFVTGTTSITTSPEQATLTIVGPQPLSFIPAPLPTQLGGFALLTSPIVIGLTEPNGLLSDILTITRAVGFCSVPDPRGFCTAGTPSSLSFEFRSDPEPAFSSATLNASVPETGAPQDLTPIIVAVAALQGVTIDPTTLTISVLSETGEGAPAAAVPEPGTLLLLGSGLAGLSKVMWRRRGQKR